MQEPDLIFDNAKKYFLLGLAHILKENWAKAEFELKKSLELIPDRVSTRTNLCVTLIKQKKIHEASKLIKETLALDNQNPELILNQGLLFYEEKHYKEALASYDRCIELKPDYAEAWSNRGVALNDIKRHDEALTSHERSIELKPDYAESWSNRGVALNDLKRHEEALASYNKAIELKPDYAEAWSNRGNALNDLKRHDEALASYNKAIELKPEYAEAWSNRGNILSDLKRYNEALASYERSIKLKPEYAVAWSNRGHTLNFLNRHEEAIASLMQAIKLKSDGDFWLGSLIHTQMKICDWIDLEQRCRVLEDRLLDGSKVSTPFAVLGLFDCSKLQNQCAEIFAKEKLGSESGLEAIPKRSMREKIRIGYFSADFHDHATMYLIAELFETHDKNRFETYAFSFGPNCNDEMRQRTVKAFGQFIDVSRLSDIAVAALSREHEIDIAIDLKGYTQDSRPQIFAKRAAPIQINYLGFPGTMGSQHLDYLIADPTLIPEDAQEAYAEKIIYLPNSYQVNDSKRRMSDRTFTRQEVGLPTNGFIFCCFNNNWKITSEIFDCWMAILQSVDKSVLWLFEDNPATVKNLRKEAIIRNVDSDRLVFAKRMPHAEHLARYKLADLFLDTLPYNAHTTASDALWAGTPVLTLQGKSFAARVASSLLTNIGLSELITRSKEEYCSLAVELALNPDKLASIKAKLTKNRLTTPLFNTKLFALHIESAYQAAYDRYHAGLPPDHIYVPR